MKKINKFCLMATLFFTPIMTGCACSVKQFYIPSNTKNLNLIEVINPITTHLTNNKIKFDHYTSISIFEDKAEYDKDSKKNYDFSKKPYDTKPTDGKDYFDFTYNEISFITLDNKKLYCNFEMWYYPPIDANHDIAKITIKNINDGQRYSYSFYYIN